MKVPNVRPLSDGPLTVPPAATRSGGQLARHAPVQRLPFTGSDESQYRVMPLGSVSTRPSAGLVAVPRVTAAGGPTGGSVAAGDGIG